MKLLVTLLPKHFSADRCMWGDVANNPISFAIAEALGRPARSVFIRRVPGTLSISSCPPIPLPSNVEDLFKQWIYSPLEINMAQQFEVDLPEEW